MGNCFQPVESQKNRNSDQIPVKRPAEKKPKNDSDSELEKRNENQEENSSKKIDFQPSDVAANENID